MKTKMIPGLLTILAAALLSTVALAESAETPKDDPFARYLYPPDRVMSHAMEIGLDDAQKTSIKNEVQKAQSKFLDLQFEMQGESEKMVRLLQEKPVNETSVLAEVDRILGLEKEIKKAQISLLIRIKNTLTPSQQAKLSELPR
jgi:Spy/CpxP family protein refolding chaperone